MVGPDGKGDQLGTHDLRECRLRAVKGVHYVPAALERMDHAAPLPGISRLQIPLKCLGILAHIVQQARQVPRVLQSRAPQALPGPLRRPHQVRIHRLPDRLPVRSLSLVGIKCHVPPSPLLLQ